MPTEHSNVVGGSTAERRINCPGSYQLEKDLPKDEASPYAIEGTVLHAAMELLLTADPDPGDELEGVLNELIGQKLMAEYDLEITEDHINEKLRPAYLAWIELCDKYEIDDYFIEQRVNLESIAAGAFGTSDVLAFSSRRKLLLCHDWKFGDGKPVDAENNYGGLFYSAGAIFGADDEDLVEAIQALPEENFKVVVSIIQPRRGFPDENPLKVWETDFKTVNDFTYQVEDAIKLANSDEPPFKPGNHCQWCAGKKTGTCKALKAIASSVDTKMDIKGLTPVELSHNVELARQVIAWGESVLSFAHAQAEVGVKIPGQKLVAKRATRVWNDEAEAEKIMKRRKCKVADMYTQKLITPAQAEKKFKDLYKKALSKEVSKVSSGTTLVPETDKRPAIVDTGHLLGEQLQKAGVDIESLFDS